MKGRYSESFPALISYFLRGSRIALWPKIAHKHRIWVFVTKHDTYRGSIQYKDAILNISRYPHYKEETYEIV